MRIEMQDISWETFGKYTHCTQHTDGLFYADADFALGRGLKKGALPSPHQSTPELTAKAQAMHQRAAEKLAASVLKPKATMNPLLRHGHRIAIALGLVLIVGVVVWVVG